MGVQFVSEPRTCGMDQARSSRPAVHRCKIHITIAHAHWNLSDDFSLLKESASQVTAHVLADLPVHFQAIWIICKKQSHVILACLPARASKCSVACVHVICRVGTPRRQLGGTRAACCGESTANLTELSVERKFLRSLPLMREALLHDTFDANIL